MVQESAKPGLTDLHLAILERLRSRGFQFMALPLYERKIGVQKGNCAVLLDPVPEGLRVFGAPSWLVAGNLSVVIHAGAERFFVWKQNKVPATAERLEELERFGRELSDVLASA